jgi:hypothetical protein
MFLLTHHFSSDAASYLPMDEIKDNKIVGLGLTPTVGGGIPSFSPGKDGKAMRMKYPTYLDFGDQRSRCLGNFDRCSNGWTVAMWLQISNVDDIGFILSSGGHTPYSNTGIALTYHKGGFMKCILKTSTTEWQAQVVMSLQTWYHVVIAWSPQNGLAVFLNGKFTIEIKAGTGRSSSTDSYRTFTIGVPNNIPTNDSADAPYYGDGFIDDLIIWEKNLSAEDITNLYYSPNYKP